LRPSAAERGWVIYTPLGSENDVQQRADFSAKSGPKRATLNARKIQKINWLDIFGLLATDQKVRSSNLFGRANNFNELTTVLVSTKCF